MSKYRFIQILFLASFFPVWIVRSALNFYEIIFTLTLFLIIPFIISFSILKEKYYLKNYFLYFISLIFVYGLDNHLGLRNAIDAMIHAILDVENFFDHGFGVYKYFAGIIILLIISIITFILIKISHFEFIKIILIFMLTIGLFNIFDASKSYKKLVKFKKDPKIKTFEKTTLILIFDAMSGIESYESKVLNGQKFLKTSNEFLKKYNFNIFNKARSISAKTQTSFINLTNLTTDIKYSKQHREHRNSLNTGEYYSKTNNYYQGWKQNKNLLFQKFNQISVYQGLAIDFCQANNVFKCHTYNPFLQRNFIDGFKNTMLSRVTSINKINGSIIGHLIWRILLELRIIDSISMPEGERPALLDTLQKVENDIYSKKFDLIFFHALVPHLPFGFTSECKFDGSLGINTSFMSNEEKTINHNNERICVINALDNLLSKVQKNNRFKDLEIFILGDHGSKGGVPFEISKHDDLNAYLAYRNSSSEYYEDNTKITIQEFFKQYFNK